MGILCVLTWALMPNIAFALWHAYDQHKQYEQCPLNRDPAHRQEDFKQNTQLISAEKREKWKLWPDIINHMDIKDGETMYGFEKAFEILWNHQHPADCSKAKFLIGGGFESGFGSELHVLGAGMTLALKLGRVYLLLADKMNSNRMDKMHSGNSWQVDIEYCRQQKNTNLNCYFEPWSSCTLADALEGTTLGGIEYQVNFPFEEMQKMPPRDDRTLIVHLSPGVDDEIPPQILNIVQCSPFSHLKHRYYWRALSIAFMMRPNAPTRQLILQHRQDKEMAFDKEKEQCVSVHIRRGDKHLEMKLIDDENLFYDSARELWAGLKNRTETSQERGVMFLGSEDAGVFTSADSWAKKNSFDVRYTNLFDRSALSTRLNSTEQAALREKNAYVHHDMEYFNMILTLDGHLRCRAFVCTQRSNYCRLVDELRATVGHKANKQYADFTCNPPCIDSPKTDIDWRR